MDIGVVEIQAYQPIFDTGRVAVLLACITFYGVLSMANFAVLAIVVVKQTNRAFRACGLLAAVNYLAGLAALPLLGDFVGLSQVAEVVGLMYLELAILATIAGHRGKQSPCVGLNLGEGNGELDNGELGNIPVARALSVGENHPLDL